MMTHLKVAVRVRPLSKREVNSISVIDVENGSTIAITNIKVPEQNAGDSRERTRRFTFDYAFEETATQDQVFVAIENVIGKAIKNRCHSCVLAYGQSSSGKTHTMMGFPHDPGLTPKLCERLFDYLEETAVGSEVSDMKISVSYLEIYNEKVRDLLHQNVENNSRKRTLKVREHPKKGPYVEGLTEHPVTSPADLISCLETGNNKRRVAATLNNPQSSRSHSVFSVCCGGVKLHLVDLAGSERADNGCYSTCRFREGANINKSLVALGNVISALAEQDSNKQLNQQQPTRRTNKSLRRRFVPYRDSVLTWLLKDTLAGNSNTVMIATVSPSSSCYSESVNTLRFGQRAKLIRSRPVLHLEDPNEKTIRELRAEIARLRELLKLQTQYPPPKLLDSMLESSTSLSTDVEHHRSEPSKSLVENDSGLNTGISDTSSCSSLNLETDDSDTISAPVYPDTHEHARNDFVPDTLNIIPEVPSGDLKDTKDKSQDEDCISKVATEKLVPLMNVSSTVLNKKQKLHRTYSVEHSPTMDKEKPKLFSSHENIRKASVTSLPPLIRRQSLVGNGLTKHSPKRQKPDGDKIEKGIVTEIKGAKAKVDSIRKTPIKPRAQMIAAVTHRLYSKTKKKEAATDTDDINHYDKPKELSICSNARFRLKELTHRALKAHRNKHEETQTELFPVLRVKEMSTDVDDLKVALMEIKDSETDMEQIISVDKAIDCKLITNYQNVNNSLHMTKSCGTQAQTEDDNKRTESNPLSFTKYLEKQSPDSKYEIVSNSCPNNPIYTSSVNINISHNYINGTRVSDTVSDDSLDDNTHNVNLPTPDLISNHNSLEQNALSGNDGQLNLRVVEALNLKFPDTEALPNNCSEHVQDDAITYPDVCHARLRRTPVIKEMVDACYIPNICAPEVCVVKKKEEWCQPLENDLPLFARPTIIEPKDYQCIDCVTVKEPQILKSIIRQVSSKSIPDDKSSDEEQSQCEIPDSLDYHMANTKKVHFRKEKKHCDNQRMIKAMSSFLEEATNLMTNLTLAANKIENVNGINEDYDIQVTVNDISGFSQCNTFPRKNRRSNTCTQTDKIRREHSFAQTNPFYQAEKFTQYDYSLPINKYEALLEDSCRRLEEKINYVPERSTTSACSFNEEPTERLSQPFSFNPWDLSSTSNYVEDSSLESNPVTFSDYGSLPRRNHRRHRTPSCSPSAYLKQLTCLRKQVIASSREELVNNSS